MQSPKKSHASSANKSFNQNAFAILMLLLIIALIVIVLALIYSGCSSYLEKQLK